MLEKLIPAHIASLVPYPPGKPLDELEREYGITNSIKLASNENPLGPSPRAVEAVRKALWGLHRYPDGSGYYLRRRISEKFDLPFEGIVLGNGSNEVIDLVIRTFVQPGDHVVLPAPSFLVYSLAVQAAGGYATPVPLKDFVIDLEAMMGAVTERTRVVFINNPNNPTGTILSRHAMEAFLDGLPPRVVVVVDEAYIEFARDPEIFKGFGAIRRKGPYVVVLRTFSKAYGLAGLRIGYGVMAPEVADYLNRVRQPFNTGSLAQAAALAALDDEIFLEKTCRAVWDGLEYIRRRLSAAGLVCVPSETNFMLVKVLVDGKKVFEDMLRRGVIIRAMNAYGLPEYIRVNAGLAEENERFVRTLLEVLETLER